MNLFLTLAFLFFIGSVFGWVLELFFRKFFSSSNPEHKWINPGFCTGPYLPIYGFGLCALYLLARVGNATGLDNSLHGKAVLFVGMAVSMTLIEYIGGLMLLKGAKIRLWDYSNCWGNIQGLICPLFSIFWTLLGAGYYFLVHPHILSALFWLSENLAFSFVIGLFFGVFLVDMASSAHWVARVKAFADENGVIVKVENLKAHIHAAQERASKRVYFFFAFRSDRPLTEHLREAQEAVEKIRRKHSNRAA
jgi:uncharacterized membrane protein